MPWAGLTIRQAIPLPVGTLLATRLEIARDLRIDLSCLRRVGAPPLFRPQVAARIVGARECWISERIVNLMVLSCCLRVSRRFPAAGDGLGDFVLGASVGDSH